MRADRQTDRPTDRQTHTHTHTTHTHTHAHTRVYTHRYWRQRHLYWSAGCVCPVVCTYEYLSGGRPSSASPLSDPSRPQRVHWQARRVALILSVSRSLALSLPLSLSLSHSLALSLSLGASSRSRFDQGVQVSWPLGFMLVCVAVASCACVRGAKRIAAASC